MNERNKRLMAVLVVLLIAVFVRLWHFDAAPPGLQHDEIFKAQEGQSLVEDGNWRVFYPSNQGHEGGYVWLLALSYLLFGANVIMIKMPALWCGLLTLAFLYRFAREAFNIRAAWIAVGLAAVSIWLVSTNRVGLRANLLPLVTVIVLWGIERICFRRSAESQRRWGMSFFTGLMLGLAIYTYTAAFVLYIAFGGFILALLLLDRPTFKRRLPELLIVSLLGAALTLPMIHYRLNDPRGRDRVNTINYPWTAFKQGDSEPLLNNARALLQMPFLKGDPEWRYNVAGRPLFLAPIGLLVYIGLLLTLWRSRRQPLNVMLVVLAVAGLVPSLLTTSAPSFLRSIIALPSTMLFIAISLDALGRSKRLGQIAWGSGILAVAVTGLADGRAYFGEWVRNEAVFAIYRDDLQQAARYLRESSEDLVLISTAEPAVLDPAIYFFSNAPRSPDVMWFDGRVTVALSEQPCLLLVSPLAPISPAHAEWLSEAQGTRRLDPILRQDGRVAFDVYRLSDHGKALESRLAQVGEWQVYLGSEKAFSTPEVTDWAEAYPYPVNFGNLLQLVGVEMPLTVIPSMDNGVDNGLQLQLYLQPLTRDWGEPLSVFVHFVAVGGEVVFGRDFLGAPANSWNPSIVFIQDNYIGSYNIPTGRYFVTMGLYNTLTGKRYPILDDRGRVLGEQIVLGQIDAVPQ